MRRVGVLLDRYRNFTPPPLAAARALRGAIMETLGILIHERSIRVHHNRADILAEGIEKTEIILHKAQILSRTKSQVGDGIQDIR